MRFECLEEKMAATPSTDSQGPTGHPCHPSLTPSSPLLPSLPPVGSRDPTTAVRPSPHCVRRWLELHVSDEDRCLLIMDLDTISTTSTGLDSLKEIRRVAIRHCGHYTFLGPAPCGRSLPHKITASDLHTFTITFLINMRMKFVMTTI